MNTQKRYNIIGFGVCGPNEKRLQQTLDEFRRLCDHTVIVGNNIDKESERLIESYGFTLWHDDREWGKEQHVIKQNAVIRLSEFNPDWVITMDMDERFDEAFTREEAENLCDRGGYGYFFYIANLYDDGYSKEWSFWNNRMFRYTANMNFAAKSLHCGLAPELHWKNSNYAPFVLWHYGLKDKEDRNKKVQRYATYDPNAQFIGRAYYDFLASKAPVSDIGNIAQQVKEEVKNYHFKDTLSERTMSEKKYYYVKNPAGVIVDIPDYQLDETLARPGFSLVSTTPIEVGGIVQSTKVEVEPPKTEANAMECEVCGFIAKTNAGLQAHKRKHG